MVYWIIAALLVLYSVLVWFVGSWANPPGAGIWILRIGLWLIGLLAAGFSVWWFLRRRTDDGEPPEITPAATDEVDLLVRDAVRRLKSSTVARGTSLGNFPLIFLVGDPGSAKTTTIVHSALDPELLAGQVYQDNNILPTHIANFWYTRQAVFVDAAGGLFSQPDLWRRLVKLVQPGRIASAGRKQQAPRAAIVCFDCESFLRPGASEATISAARRLSTRLIEVSQVLGISFPIYVFFTRADRIGARADGGSHFLDYMAGLSKDEAAQVLGTTLPVRSLQATGVYADEETKRLEKAFDEIFYSLAEKRLDLLSRTAQLFPVTANPGSLSQAFLTQAAPAGSASVPGIYEFPRELHKLRGLLVQFLVNLARPTQLDVNPFLRGFYFSGVRPVVIEEVGSALPEVQEQESGYDANATVVFGGQMRGARPAPVAHAPSSRKVPEWIFLSQFFNEVLLKDRVALSASGFSSRVSLLRRIALATVGVIALIFAIGFLVSFVGNLSLEHSVKQAADDVSQLRSTPGQTPTAEQLQTLDRLRQQLETISSYNREGPPWHLRWWLYSGEDLYPPTREIYFKGFRDLLFAETQGKLLTIIRNVKDRPAPGESYEATYNPLKAYLITTSNPEKSTQEFLPPILYKTWAEGKVIGDERIPDLARRQFEFYSSELPISNPFPSGRDAGAIGRAQAYLKNFAGIDLYYSKLKLDASEKIPAASFNRQFRDTVDVVLSTHDVEGAFTPDGFKLVQDAIAHNRIANEDWVVGKSNALQLESSTLQQQLSDRYYKDYIEEWRTVLRTSAVRPYASLRDADAKLEKLTTPSSPLLELFWFVSHNTHVPLQQISDSFQPVQAVVPDGPPNHYVVAANQSYLTKLGKVKTQIKSLVDSPTGAGDLSLVNQTQAAAGEAEDAVDQMAQNFNVDSQFHLEAVAQTLLKEPIEHARAVISVAPKEPLNGAGKSFCSQLGVLTYRFPFNPSSTEDVSLDQLNMIFAPGTGTFWTTYKDKWSQYLQKQGSHYVASNAGSVKITDSFLAFFNRAAALSEALYANGSPTPRLSYSLTQVASNVDGLALKVGNETLSGTGQSKNFLWIGASEDVLATSKDVAIDVPHSGTWAIFHFIYDGHPALAGGGYNLNFVRQSNGQDITLNGKRQSYSYQLHFSGVDPLVDFGRLNCVSQVAR